VKPAVVEWVEAKSNRRAEDCQEGGGICMWEMGCQGADAVIGKRLLDGRSDFSLKS